MTREILRKEIERAVKKLYGLPAERVDFGVSSNAKFGDYSSNVAMLLKKDAKEIAEEIKSPYISKIEIAGPGFLNFYLSEKGLIEGLKNISDFPKQGLGQKIQLEFISANPTGELHIGHGRSAFYGDALANILEKASYEVEREYFINDYKESVQIRGLISTAHIIKKEDSFNPVREEKIPYDSEYLREIIKSGKVIIFNVAKEIQKHNQEFITNILGIKFDNWFSEEKELAKKTEFEKTLELLKKKKLIYEKDGALWLKTSQYGDAADRVIVRSSGKISYFLSDIAYHLNKIKRGYKKIIDIWGADHQGHVKRMLAVKKMLHWKGDLDILISQLVTLKEGKERKKLSKRKGDIILLKDLIKEVGLDACRWFYLEKSLSTHMEFDMALAKEQSQKNPVYYVQYAGARMNSILARSQFPISKFQTNSKFQISKPIRNLILKLIQFPEVIEDITNDYQVQRLIKYAYELASEFSQFYRDVRVIGSKNEKELLALVSLTRKVLEDTLNLMGISSPKKM